MQELQKKKNLEDNNLFKHFVLWVRISADDILKYFSYFFQQNVFYFSCKLSPQETIFMKCQRLFSGENQKNIISLLSAEFVCRVVKVKLNILIRISILKYFAIYIGLPK